MSVAVAHRLSRTAWGYREVGVKQLLCLMLHSSTKQIIGELVRSRQLFHTAVALNESDEAVIISGNEEATHSDVLA